MSLRMNTLIEESQAEQMNPLQLAYLGDSVWEIIVRHGFLIRGYNVHHLHKRCVDLVNARSQAGILRSIEHLLNEKETEIVRRGRNAHSKHPAPRNQDPADYALSTGFEALFGYLYLTGKDERIRQLVEYLKEGDLFA